MAAEGVWEKLDRNPAAEPPGRREVARRTNIQGLFGCRRKETPLDAEPKRREVETERPAAERRCAESDETWKQTVNLRTWRAMRIAVMRQQTQQGYVRSKRLDVARALGSERNKNSGLRPDPGQRNCRWKICRITLQMDELGQVSASQFVQTCHLILVRGVICGRERGAGARVSAQSFVLNSEGAPGSPVCGGNGPLSLALLSSTAGYVVSAFVAVSFSLTV